MKESTETFTRQEDCDAFLTIVTALSRPNGPATSGSRDKPPTYYTIHICFNEVCDFLIQFPPEMDENWVRYGLAKLGQISRLPNWQRMLFCAYTTQLLHSTGEVCWNNKDSYFIWFEFVC